MSSHGGEGLVTRAVGARQQEFVRQLIHTLVDQEAERILGLEIGPDYNPLD